MRSVWSAAMPMPVSRTMNASKSCSREMLSVTWPAVVNLIALPSRLCSTCFSRAASVSIQGGSPSPGVTSKRSPFWLASGSSRSVTSRTRDSRRAGPLSITRRPASILDRSSRSPMTVFRCRLDCSITASCGSCAGLVVERRSIWVMPRMPFNGVRISWLTIARKRLLAWLECSASSSARCRWSAIAAFSWRRRMSSAIRRSSPLASISSITKIMSRPLPRKTELRVPCQSSSSAFGISTMPKNSALARKSLPSEKTDTADTTATLASSSESICGVEMPVNRMPNALQVADSTVISRMNRHQRRGRSI